MGASESTVVLDSSAVIALFRDEPAAPRVEQLLREERTRMSTINAAETIDVLVRVYGRTVEEVAAGVEELFAAGIEPVAPSPDLAKRAGELRARIYDRRHRRVSLADCFVLATATEGDTIVTTDGTLAGFADDEGIEVVALPESVS